MTVRPFFQDGEVGNNQYGREAPPVAEQGRLTHKQVRLERTLDRLRCDEFSARGLDQVFLAVGNGEVSIRIQDCHVSSLEPSIFKCCSAFLGHLPVTLEYRR